LILDALQRLEYRGYDSAGIATLSNGHIERRRAPGKLHNLAAVLAAAMLPRPRQAARRACLLPVAHSAAASTIQR